MSKEFAALVSELQQSLRSISSNRVPLRVRTDMELFTVETTCWVPSAPLVSGGDQPLSELPANVVLGSGLAAVEPALGAASASGAVDEGSLVP